ncbi:uncharacterized protein BT62DRAFT_1001296 [Guyanagaster necrorhizus]|uniref:Large ribosomal subunit protein bL32m n=1 Tax=Guyanagaster necrorhizus TaxID=856835 RepID=A0A9P7W1X6_9AGAR|nr:uncharacterized protein BT62DRAFT_1001296 [Guyanagaster necrorhizus MCA 3950]KAG7450479.1 hypothetical protein BT62DRAFT_1001296 [Guyanagaster necrorhizus MCA 3950]
MAALAFTRNSILPTNPLFTLFRIPVFKPLFPPNLLPAFLTTPHPFTWRIPSLLELFPSIVLAVPKKKTSHSRKAMRAANKGLKDKHSALSELFHASPLPNERSDIVNCPGCGTPKLAHHLCSKCYSFLSRTWKNKLRGMPDLS